MKKRIPFLLIALLLLSACTAGEKTPETPSETPAVSPSASVTPEAPAPSPEPVSETPEVENNGGYFVRVGDRVYFRKYGPDALMRTTIFANFLESCAATDESSEIMAYDLKTGETEACFTDTGCGRLWYADGGFWLQEMEGDELTVAWRSLDGKTERGYPAGTLLAVTDGGLAVAEQYEYGEETSTHRFMLYKALTPIAEYVTEDYVTFAGATDDAIFLLRHDTDPEDEFGPETLTLVQVSADGKNEETVLGVVPEAEDMYDYSEVAQFIAGGGEIGVVIGYYAGTMRLLNDAVFLRAVPGEAVSLTVIDAEYEPDEDEWQPPKLYRTDAGAIAAAPHLKGEVDIGWQDEEDGDLRLFDGNAWRTIAADFCPGRADGSGYQRALQTGEYVGGRVFTVAADAYASPLDDIGWREAYALLGMRYAVVPADGGEPEELSYVPCDAAFEGYIWIARDRSAVLWQQTADDLDALFPEAYYAFLIPAAPDAAWENAVSIPEEALFDVADLPEGDYYGYELPAGEGIPAVLKLDGDGNAVSITIQ